MIAEPLVQVRCTVCEAMRHRVLCGTAEVAAHLVYLRRFHRRRLRHPTEEALADRADFTQDYATDIVECEACGLVFRSPRPPAEAIEGAYEQDHYGHRRLAAMFGSQVELYRPKARSLARFLPRGSRVVEVGSFVGGFLAAGREQGWNVLGVDPGREVDSFCAERGLPVFRGTLPGLLDEEHRRGPEPGTVDLTAIWNAFDQLPDPVPTLAAARKLLRAGGLLAIRVPNGECFRQCIRLLRQGLPAPLEGWLRDAMAWNNLLAFPYLHGYTLPTLDWLVTWHGLERCYVASDTLCRLADASTRRWAALEERVLKALIRCAARIEQALRRPTLAISPWLDVYFRAV